MYSQAASKILYIIEQSDLLYVPVSSNIQTHEHAHTTHTCTNTHTLANVAIKMFHNRYIHSCILATGVCEILSNSYNKTTTV